MLLLVALIVLCAGGAAGWWWVAHHGWTAGAAAADKTGSPVRPENANLGFSKQYPPTGSDAKAASAVRCETVCAQVVAHNDILGLTGTLIADEKSSVAANTSGIAAEVRVDRGSIVRKNDVLVQIDATDAKNRLAEGRALLQELLTRLGLDDPHASFDPDDQPEVKLAKAAAGLATANLQRATAAYARKAISSEAFDQFQTEVTLATQRHRQALLQVKQAQRAYQTALVRLAMLEKAVADTTIRAPFDGLVAEKLVAVGEQISSGMQATKVVTLVRIDPLRLSLTVPQQDIGCIEAGQTVRFRVDSYPERTFTAQVRFIAPVVANDTRSMFVEAVAPNSDGALRPGLFATAEVELKQQQSSVFVPAGAVERSGETASVYVVRDGLACQQVVATGEAAAGRVEIRAGLTGKETLVAHPEAVHDGATVQP